MSDPQNEAGTLFRAGKLTPAIEAAGRAVRNAPTDTSARMLLAELLLFDGNLERADVILAAAGQIEPEAAVVVAEFRQLLRAETARRQLHRDGRVPAFLGAPTETLAAQLAALVALRDRSPAEATAHAEEAERIRPRVPGAANDAAFNDFRDADDLCAGYFEVLTTTGKYMWIPTEQVETVAFHPPMRPRDLCWRRASMSVRRGPDGDVYLPAIYCNDTPARADELRLGRSTDWDKPDTGPVCGIGQRMFLAGDEPLSIMELTTLRFDAAA
jgi:type VI secretion system protein ImpE